MKNLFKFVFVLGIVFSSFAFGQYSKLEKTLSENVSFRKICNLHDVFESIPNKGNVKNFNNELIVREGNSYIAETTGFSENQVSEINKNLQVSLEAVLKDFPELRKMNEKDLETIVGNASNLYYDEVFSSAKAANPCQKRCARMGRALMAAGTFLGAATGSALGFNGAWAGATLGFWAAAEQTLACLDAC